jgi:hypothetical protein
MAAVRSQNIYGRIKRVLRIKGVPEDALLLNDIYDEMNEGQKQAMLRAPIEAVKTIAMVVGTTDYALTVTPATREIYGSISRFIRPSTWDYTIQYVYPNEWDDIVNGGGYDDYSNPVRATIFANTLKLYPAPLAVANLTVHALLKMPSTDLSKTVEPETPEDYDNAIEEWALWKLLGDVTHLQAFEKQIEIVGNVNGYKGFLIQKPRMW